MTSSLKTHLLALSLAFSLLLSHANVASAAYGTGYIALDGSSLSVSSTEEEDANPRGLRLRLGTRISEGFDLELHFGGGSDDTTQAYDELGIGYLGGYLKGYLPIGQRSALFALVGGAAVEFTQQLPSGSFSDERMGFSYGIGLETQVSRWLDLSADVVRYTLSEDDFSEVSAVNLGLKLYF